MEEKALKTLEFHKILNLLSDLAVTEEGKNRSLELRPSTDKNEVIEWLAETSEAESMILRKGNPPLSPIKNVRPSLKRTQIGAVLSMPELRNIAHLLRIARGCAKYMNERDFTINYPVLSLLYAEITPLEALEKRILDAIISEEEMADNASPTLFQLRKRKITLNNKIRDVLNDMIHSAKYQNCLQDALVTMRGDRFVIPVKSEHKNDVPGIIHDSSQSGATFFVEPMAIVEINNELRKIASDEKEEIERILAEFSAEVEAHRAEIESDFSAVVGLDFCFAKAKLSLKMDAMPPKINQEGRIYINKGRHPLLDPKKVVPIDIYLGDVFDTLVITGPNTGGKTVALKTLGLFTLMAQAGLNLPTKDNSEIAVFRQVFADIGDEQSIEQSLSTFSAHMVNIVHILDKADEKSLILFDELGAGTDPIEGAALAVSILEYVKSCGAKTAATTHYSELKTYALTTERAVNAACEFNVDTLSPTYKLLIGVPGKSNAFAISKRLGLSDYIIERAKERISAENVKLEDVISDLEADRRKAEAEKELASKERADAEEFRKKSAEEQKRISQLRDQFLERARREAKQIVDDAKAESEELIRELKEAIQKKEWEESNQLVEKTRRMLNQKRNELNEQLGSQTLKKHGTGIPRKKIKLGDTVSVSTLGQEGTVLTLPDSNGNLQVQVGILKVNTHLSDLSPVEETKGKEIAKRYVRDHISRDHTPLVKRELHVRGMMLEEAEQAVDRFLDDAVLANLEEVIIVHGKGTGVLRKGIQTMLKTHPHVKSYRLGRYGEGEDGVTIVTLK